MNYKYCKKRRIFLAQASLQLGLVSLSNLFSLKAFSQTSTGKKYLISIFFNHGANIPFGDEDKTFHKGGFTFDNGSNINGMKSIAGDALFIRGVRSHGNSHSNNAIGNFTGSSNGSGVTGVNVIAGQELRKKYGSKIDHLCLGFNMHFGDGIKRNLSTSPQWRTITFNKGKFVLPEINVDSSFKKMMSSLDCSDLTALSAAEKEKEKLKLDNEIKKLIILNENYSDFQSTYLVPKEELEKINSQINSKIESKRQKIKDINEDKDDAGDACKDIDNPRNSYTFNDSIKPHLNEGIRQESYSNFHNKSQAYFDLMVTALKYKYKYTNSITYTTNIWSNQHHGSGGHKHYNNPVIISYLDELSKTLNTLFVKLKNAGIYDETMIAIAGEFALQNRRNDPTQTHRGDNLPWLVVNSGKSGDLNLKRKIHTGDIHCNILQRFGFNYTKFGTDNRQIGGRAGNFDTKILV